MPCSQITVVTCSYCHEEFIVRIAASTAREYMDKYRNYACPHCRKALSAHEGLVVCAA